MLDRQRLGRTFRRITGAALTSLLDGGDGGQPAEPAGGPGAPTVPTGEAHKPTTSAGSADLEDKPGDGGQ